MQRKNQWNFMSICFSVVALLAILYLIASVVLVLYFLHQTDYLSEQPVLKSPQARTGLLLVEYQP